MKVLLADLSSWQVVFLLKLRNSRNLKTFLLLSEAAGLSRAAALNRSTVGCNLAFRQNMFAAFSPVSSESSESS